MFVFAAMSEGIQGGVPYALRNCMRHHNWLRQRGLGPSLTCRVGICWIRPYGDPCDFLARFGFDVIGSAASLIFVVTQFGEDAKVF